MAINSRIGPEDWGKLPVDVKARAEKVLDDPFQGSRTVEIPVLRSLGRGATEVVMEQKVIPVRRSPTPKELRDYSGGNC